jgi:uncharacterized protein (DUF697 family)
MASLKDISSIWTNIKEIDLKPYRDAALRQVKIALVGSTGSGRHTLAELLRLDPAQPEGQTQSPLAILQLESAESATGAELIILLVDLTRAEIGPELALARRWNNSGRKLLVLGTHLDVIHQSGAQTQWPLWQAAAVLYGSLLDMHFIQRNLVPAILELLPDQHIALGRQFPLFRQPVAHQLINETCFSNTAYSVSTGLAEIVPVLDLPLNITDMIVLTKSQAFLAYKMGLLLGFSTRWQDYLAEFGSVIGGGFLWRQLARGLIGLIPIWGIVPKVAISYAGTYVVGNTILQWYLTGRHLSAKQMQALYRQAFGRGKDFARGMLAWVPRPRLGRRKPAELLAPTASAQAIVLDSGDTSPQIDYAPQEPEIEVIAPENLPLIEPTSQTTKPIRRLRLFGRKKVKKPKKRICTSCKKVSAGDAVFCQYCGTLFE